MGNESKASRSEEFKRGFKDGLAICLGYVPIAFAFGVAATKLGFKFWLSEFMGALVYTASGQFSLLNLIQGGEELLFTYALTIFVVNCRYILLSLSLSQRLDKNMGVLERMAFGFFNTDEIFAVANGREGKLQAPYLFGIATLPFFGWTLGTAAGCLFTNIMPASVSAAMGIIVYAMYLAIVIPPAKTSKPIAFVLLISTIISVLLECNPLVRGALSPGWIIIICAVATSLIGAIFFPVEDGEGEE